MPAPLAIPLIQTGAGILQSLIGGNQARQAQRGLERMARDYKPNAGILDYYNKALSKYNVNPYTSSLYNYASERARAGTAQGISSLQDRRSALSGIPSLVQGQNDALLKAAATAEGQQAQALGQLGQASQVKAREEFKPFEMKYNLLSAKAGAGNQIVNAGLSNIFGGLQSAGNMTMLDSMYGNTTQRQRRTTSGGATGGVGYAPDFDNYGQPGG